MNNQSLQDYLHRHIPLSQAMQVSVLDVCVDRVVLRVPLAPNLNHRNTAFGGSVSAVGILAAWSLVHTRLTAAGMESRVVIQRSIIDYDLPIAGDFTARAQLTAFDKWDVFVGSLQRRGKARIAIGTIIECAGRVTGRLEGVFVALRPRTDALPAATVDAGGATGLPYRSRTSRSSQ